MFGKRKKRIEILEDWLALTRESREEVTAELRVAAADRDTARSQLDGLLKQLNASSAWVASRRIISLLEIEHRVSDAQVVLSGRLGADEAFLRAMSVRMGTSIQDPEVLLSHGERYARCRTALTKIREAATLTNNMPPDARGRIALLQDLADIAALAKVE